ncbi:MAG: hypothetical protein H6602_01215 [Flavobacteriales bacterium]|nr:hypothetical protein [Flavobacteriales bacterium]
MKANVEKFDVNGLLNWKSVGLIFITALLYLFFTSYNTKPERQLQSNEQLFVANEELEKALNKALIYLEKNSFKINDQQEIVWATLLNQTYSLNLNIPSRETLTKAKPDSKYWQHKLYRTYYNPELEVLNDRMIDRFEKDPESIFLKQSESTRMYSLYCEKLTSGRQEFLHALSREIEQGNYPELNILDPVMMLQTVLNSGCVISDGEEEREMLRTLLLPFAKNFENDRLLAVEPVETKGPLFSLSVLLYTGNTDLVSVMVVPYLVNLQLENGGFPGNTAEEVDSYFHSLLGAWSLLELKRHLKHLDKIEGEQKQTLARQILTKTYYSYDEFDELRNTGVQSKFDSLLNVLGITEKQYQDSINNIPKGQIFEEGSYRPAW